MSKKHAKRLEDTNNNVNEVKPEGEIRKLVLDKSALEQIASLAAQQVSPISTTFVVSMTNHEFAQLQESYDRRLYLYGAITPAEEYCIDSAHGTNANNIIEKIMNINRMDVNTVQSERDPIILYINSPGGSVVEGFAIIEAIKASKTPVYTVKIGQWSSMAFLIGITGHRRFSLPNMTFLFHDGWNVMANSSNKVRDLARFDTCYEKKVVRKHVLEHTKLSLKEYKKRAREEFYMLTDDALKYGVIDHIVTDIDDIL
jgi:ATP-dependent Clp protease protease subunit